MSVSNGQDANATTFNNAYQSKTADNTSTGVQSLENGSSGGSIANVQQQINDNESDIAVNASAISVNAGNIPADTDDLTEGSGNLYNQTHTGEVTGSISLAIDPTAITNKTTVSAASGDFVLISDTSDSGSLKKVNVDEFTGGGGASNDINLTLLDNADTPYTVLSTDELMVCDTSSGVVQVDLPAAVDDRVIRITKSTGDSTGVAIQPDGSDTVGGASTTTLHTKDESIFLVGDGTNGDWIIVDRKTRTEPVTVTTIPMDSVNSDATKGSTDVDEYRWHREGQFCTVQYRFQMTSTGTVGTGDYIAGLPFSADTSYHPLNTAPIQTSTEDGSLGTFEGHGRFTGTSGMHDVVPIMYDADNFRIFFGRVDTAGRQAWGLPSGSFHSFNRPEVNAYFTVKYKVNGWNK